jgi:Skp family chaperone for outer membrane proteins
MSKQPQSKSIEQLLAEADELIQKINSDAIKDLKEEHRLEFEKHHQNLNKIKAEVQERAEKKEAAKLGSGAEGVHAAIQDIVKAMGDLSKYLS